MKREEIEERIKELEKQRFYLAMNDHWTQKDYETDRALQDEIKELEGRLKDE